MTYGDASVLPSTTIASAVGDAATIDLFDQPQQIADLSVPEQTVYLYGLQPGSTTLSVYDADGDMQEVTVTVVPKRVVITP